MALYKNATYIKESDSSAFDAIHNPGSNTPNHGIYRCEGCGHEIVSEKDKPFPPQNHHQHTQAQGAIRWRLIVFSQGK